MSNKNTNQEEKNTEQKNLSDQEKKNSDSKKETTITNKKTEKKPGKKKEQKKNKPQKKKKSKFSLFKKKTKNTESIASIYKQAAELFQTNSDVEKEAKEEETILAHIMDKRQKRRKRTIIISALIFLFIIAAASIFGFIVFNKRKQFAEDKIKISIIGPDETQIGEEVTYLINYENEGQVALKDVKLFVRMPKGFSLTEQVPETENSTWNFDKIKINESGQIKIKGKLITQVDTTQKINATISYNPENFNSEFSKIETHSTQVLPLELEALITNPQNAIPGQKFNLTLSYSNPTEIDYEKLIIKLVSPADFSIIQSQPKSENNEWVIENIKADNNEQEITVEGIFSEDIDLATIEKNQPFEFQILYPGEFDQNFVQKSEQFTIELSDQELLAYLIINGKTENSNTSYGENINCTAVIKNTSDQDVEDAGLIANITEWPLEVLDWKNSDLSGGDLEDTEEGSQISWNISNLNAYSENVIEFSIPIKKLAALQDFSNESLAEQNIKLYLQLTINEEEPTIDSSTIEIKLNTDIALGIKALYYDQDGNEIGSGPLPPQANEKTTYKIFWDISNNLHEITDVKIKATLADKVSWSGNEQITTGQINYNSDTNQITWEINRLPQSVNEAHTNFELSLEPTNDDIGKLMKLTENTSLEAKDSITGDSLIISLNPISTNLEFDEEGKEKGVITQQVED